MTFARPPAGDDPLWPRASAWLGAGDPATAPLRVVGVPCSVGSISPSQAWRTPAAVRSALVRLSPWDAVSGTDLLAELPAADLGDWPVADDDLPTAIERIATLAERLRTDSGASLPVDHTVYAFLGGDNAITRPLVAGLLGPDLATVGLVTLDAHHDVRHLDEGPRNGTPVRGLLEDGLPGGNVVQVGIGAFSNSAPYRAWCDDHGITAIGVDRVHAQGVDAIVEEALRHLDGCTQIFVDVDVDVLDVAYAPACPGARPGGFTPGQLFAAVRLLADDPRVVACDLVEVDAATDHDGRTVMATAMTLLAFAAGVAGRSAGEGAGA